MNDIMQLIAEKVKCEIENNLIKFSKVEVALIALLIQLERWILKIYGQR
ncbi:MAG: hypothetical protein H5T96_08610 [Tissierellales bacterium]|nr:hypothetical protein [Tissierellales bacterium]